VSAGRGRAATCQRLGGLPRTPAPTAPLTVTSEYLTISVVTENTGSPFFELPPAVPPPRPGRVPLVVDAARIDALDVDGLVDELTTLLASLKNRTPDELVAGGIAPDASIAIKSLIAVCLIGTVGKAFGRPRLVNLSQVPRDDLRSVRGVARLIRTALDQRRRGAA